MGREIKRVPVDFDHPTRTPWPGYVPPKVRKCPDCEAGWSKAYEAIKEHINGLMWGRAAMEIPEVGRVTGFLADRAPRSPFGHDSLDASYAVTRLGELAGLGDGWDRCPTCDGSGVHPEDQATDASWERTNPPDGPGYQVWETVSEGSPISPVFAMPEECVEWLVSEGYSRSGAEAFVNAGRAPSFVLSGSGGLARGIDAMTPETRRE